MLNILIVIVATTMVAINPFPEQILKEMINSVYLPEATIELEGTDNQGVLYFLKYDRNTDTLTEIIGENENNIPGDEIDPFLRLFFFQADNDKPESFSKVLKDNVKLLEGLEIDLEKQAFSVSDADGRITVAIGKSKRFEKANNIQFYRDTNLPASLETGERKILFSQYHKSILPLVFPGRIDIFHDGELSSSVFFLREEYRQ